MKKVLLLNYTYEVLSFLTEQKAIKLLCKDKVEVLSTWEDEHYHIYGKKNNFPSILRLKYYVKKHYSQLSFSRKAVFKRDKFHCQYCNKPLKPGQATVDHIMPKCLGGISSFTNCVTACYICNNKKGKKTLDNAGMKLLKNPLVPDKYTHFISENDHWHGDWNKFFGIYHNLNT